MAKLGGKLLIKYRDPVAASFSSKDIVLNVQTGTLFYKRNRKLFALRGTPDNFDLVVFPGQSTNQQILINDSSQEDGSPIMEGTDQFRFKLASATCGCANYFHIGAETLTHFSGSVRIGEHLPGTCNLLDNEVNPALKIYGNVSVVESPSGSMDGHITASGNIEASIDLYGTNAYIHGSLIHRNNTDTKLTFGTDTINLYSDGSSIATVSSDRFTVNGSNDLFIPGTNSAPASGTSVLVLDNSTGQVYKTGSYGGETFKTTGIRIGDSQITGSLDISSAITASKAQFTNLNIYPGAAPNFSVLTELNGNVFTTSSAAFNHYNFASVANNSNIVTSNAQIINFVGDAVTATGGGNLATITINALTESLWYDGRHFSSSFLSSSYNILVGNGGNISASGALKHNIQITSSNQSSSIGFTNASSSHWSTGVIQSSQHNIFHISDHGTSNTDTGTQVLKIYGTGSGDLLSAPEAISIHSGLRTGGATPNPTFIGATDVNIPTIMIDPASHSTSLAKLHINTMGADPGLLYNGLLVGPSYNASDPKVRTGSGVFIHVGEPLVGDFGDTSTPRITGKTEQGDAWGNDYAKGLLITAETDRSDGYPGGQPQFGNAVGRSTVMEFKVKDVAKQAYSASAANPSTTGISSFTLGGHPSSSMADVYGIGEEFIIGMETVPRISTNRDANYLYSFKNDLMPLLSIEASGKVGIGNFNSHTVGKTLTPQAMLDITAKSGSDADIFLKTSTINTIPLIKLEVDDYGSQNMSGASTRLYNPNLFRGEFYIHTEYASGSFYEKQKTNSVVIESKGKEEGLAGQTYPFNIKGATKNNFEANNIQLVVGGDNSPNRNSSITSSHIHDGVYPSFSTNNGRAAITIEGISDFRRFGEVGIGLENPSSSLHVTKSVQADNFRTTNPVDILISGSNHSIQMVYGSNIVSGSNTKFLDDFKVGDAIKITGRSIIATPHYEYEVTASHNTASVHPPSAAAVRHQQFVSNDLILISSSITSPVVLSGSYHSITSVPSSSMNNTVYDNYITFEPAYTGATTSSYNIIHRINPHHYQIATVTGIDSQHSMSISQVWEGTTWSGSKGYKESILFEVKTADYRPVFSIAADGTTTIGGSIGTFKSTGLRAGNSIISGNLTLRPLDTLPTAELHIISRDTGSVSDSILTLKQYDQGNNTTGSKIMYNAGDNEFQILGNKGIDKHLTIHHDSGLVTVNENLTVEKNITASNNISASGLLYASSSQGNYSNVVVQDTASGRFYTTSSAALTTTAVDTFKSTGVRTGDSILSGSLIIRSTGATNPGDANLTIVGGGSSADDATLSLRQNLATAGYAVKYDGGLDHFQILGNNESDVHLSIQHGDGRVRIPGTISSSGAVFHGGLTYGTADSLVTVVAATGEFKRQGIAGALANAGVGLVSSSQQIADDVSGSFLLNTTDTLTGDLTVTGTITAQEFHTEFVSSSIIFTSGSTQFGNSADDIHIFSGSINVKDEGHITASGNISASGTVTAEHILSSDDIVAQGNISASGTLHAGLTAGLTNFAVFYDTNTGELKHEVAPSSFTTTGISGSWQGYITGSGIVSSSTQIDTFKSTGIRTGDGFIDGDITGSNKLLIQKSVGPGFPIGTSDVAIFQNNAGGKDASIAIIAADARKSQLHFGRSGSIDQGSIKYLHHGNASGPDKMIFRVSGSNVITLSNPTSLGPGRGAIGVGGDHNYPTDYFHAQGSLSGHGLMLSSSNGTGITMDRGSNSSKFTWEFKTAGVTKWTLGNIAESNDNLYIYNGTSDKHIKITPTETNFLTSISASGNITASGNISASGLLYASSSTGNYSNIVVQDTSSGRFYTTSSMGLSVGLDTFKTTGQRNGDSGITGSLHLTGSTSNLTIDGTSHFKDNVGIGVTPNTNNNIPLHIKSINVAAASQTPTLLIESDDASSAAFIQFKNVDANYLLGNVGGGGNDGFFLKTVTPNKFPFFVSKDASSFMLSVNQNKVGIGYSNPSHTLHVSGNIVADGSNGSISASGTLKAGLSNTDNANLVFYNPVGGELTYAASSSFLSGLLSSSNQIESDISGAINSATSSLSASLATSIADNATNTFKSTGQRSGNSAITGSLTLTSHLTASGNISASGYGHFANLQVPAGGYLRFDDVIGSDDQYIIGNENNITVDGDQFVKLIANDSIEVGIATNDIKLTIDTSEGHITASGNISASGNMFANHITLDTGGVTATGHVIAGGAVSASLQLYGNEAIIAGNISATGNISSSGLLFASSSVGNYSNVIVQDTASGRFYTTSSAALTTTLPGGLLSSSNQIEDDISGSWQGQNFFNNVTQFIGVSAVFNTAVSGAFTSVSQSIAEDINNNNVLIIDNTSAIGANSTLIQGNTQDIASNTTAIAALPTGTDISGSFLLNTTDTLAGDLTVTNNILSYGNVQVGNTSNISHITASGNISASGKNIAHSFIATGSGANLALYGNGDLQNITGSGKILLTSPKFEFGTNNVSNGGQTSFMYLDGDLDVRSHITASNISASGLLFASASEGNFSDIVVQDITTGRFYTTSSAAVGTTDTFKLTGQRNGDSAITGALEVVGNISASGAITASGLLLNTLDTIEWLNNAGGRQTIKGKNNYIQIDGDNRILMAADNDITINSPETNISGDVSASGKLYGTDIYAVGNITSSANISASGLLYASSSQGNYSNIVVQDTASGRFYTTASAAIIPDTFKTTGQRSGSSGITGSLVIHNPSTGYTVSINNAYGNVSSPSGMGQFNTLQIFNNAAIGTATFGGGYGSTGASISATGGIQTNGNLTVDGTTTLGLTTGDRTTIRGHLTASGNISASGLLYASASSANGNPYQTVMINTSSGEFFYTGSYGGGGGGGGSFLLDTTDTFTGALKVAGQITASSNQDFPLRIDSAGVNRQDGVGIEFISQDNFGQRGHISFTHFDSESSGSGASFRLGSNQSSTSIIIDKLVASGDITSSGGIHVGGKIFAPNIDLSSQSNILYYDSSTGEISFESPASTAFSIGLAGDNATTQTMNNGDQLKVLGTAPISTTVSSADTVTISHDNIGAGAGTYGSTANGTKIDNIVIDAQGHVTSVTTGATGDIDGVTASTGLSGGGSSGTPSISIDYNGSNNFITSTPNGAMSSFADGDRFSVVDVSLNPDTVKYLTGTVLKTWIQGFTSNTTGTVTSVGTNTGLSGTVTSAGNLSLDLISLTNATPVGTDQIIFTDTSDSNNEKREQINQIGLSIFNNDIDGNGLSVFGGTLNFDPGGNTGAMITSNGGTGYNVHNTLTYDGADLRVHSGDIIAFYSSDKRLKDNVIPITNPISKIMKIGGYTFDWNEKQDTYSGHDVGVIAQEVEKVLPEVVETRENGYKAVKYDKMVPLLIEAIKDQQKQIDELKKLIENGKQ